jgi:hypothetical protein
MTVKKEKLRHRDIALSLLGALIILGSFIVKDVLQDMTKEKVAKLEALNSSRRQSDAQDIELLTLDGIANSICSLPQAEGKVSCGKFFGLPSSEYSSAWIILAGTFFAMPAPPVWSDSSPREKYKRRLDEFQASIKVLDEETKAIATSKQQPAETKSSMQVHEDSLRSLSQLVQKTGHTTDLGVQKIQLASELNELIESEERQNEFLYSVYRTASYCLFALGWGLALYGKLFHVPGISAPD